MTEKPTPAPAVVDTASVVAAQAAQTAALLIECDSDYEPSEVPYWQEAGFPSEADYHEYYAEQDADLMDAPYWERDGYASVEEYWADHAPADEPEPLEEWQEMGFNTADEYYADRQDADEWACEVFAATEASADGRSALGRCPHSHNTERPPTAILEAFPC